MQVGLSLFEYDYFTPRQLELKVRAYKRNMKVRKEESIYNAWLTAKLSNSKKIPELSKLMPKEKNENNVNRSKHRMQDYEIDIHFQRFLTERRVLYIG